MRVKPAMTTSGYKPMPKAYRQNSPPTKEVPEPKGLGIAPNEEG